MAALAGSLMLPSQAKSAGLLEVVNYNLDFSTGMNSVRFDESMPDSEYMSYPSPPSLETYYEDAISNKHSVAGVNLSASKYYDCPLEGWGSIPDGTSNSIAFKIYSDFPSNTLCTAKIECENYATNVNDVIKYYNDNPKDGDGYVHVIIPATTNASNRKYGNVQIRFAPLEEIVASAGSNGTISPAGTTKIPYSDGTNFNITANEDYRISDVKTNGASIGQTFDNSSTNFNYNWPNITADGAISANFTNRMTTNGIPHTWLTQYGITNKTDGVETNDADYDGLNNLHEYIADTNPTNDASVLPSLGIAQGASIDLTINPTSAGRDYGIYSKTNLLDAGDWSHETNSTGNGGSLTFSMNDAAGDKKFYRYRISKP